MIPGVCWIPERAVQITRVSSVVRVVSVLMSIPDIFVSDIPQTSVTPGISSREANGVWQTTRVATGLQLEYPTT